MFFIKINIYYPSLKLCLFLCFIFSLFITSSIFAQQNPTFKKNIIIPDNSHETLIIPQNNIQSKSQICSGYIEDIGNALNITWNKDDGSSPLINLPFTFCFYGENVNSLYMNNNGNLSFYSQNSSISASVFPSLNNKVIAGFWADFDFTSCGTMHVNFINNAAIFTWKDVGYFDANCSKKNTFQIVLTDGTDPLIEDGNIAINYKDMNWTSGDTPNSSNGFYGTPACIGANKGDAINSFQLGFFDHDGLDYDGPAGNNDGIKWLNNRSFKFNLCTSNGNIAPISNNVEPCVPIELCSKGDTLNLNFSFIAPENNQLTAISYSSSTIQNIQVLNNVTGFEGKLSLQIIGEQQNIGSHYLTVSAIDNALPFSSNSLTYQINVIDGDSVIPVIPQFDFQLNCPPIAIHLTDTNFDTFDWFDGTHLNYDSVYHSFSGDISLIVSRGICKALIDSMITVPQIPHFNFEGNLNYCDGNDFTILSVMDSVNYSNIDWHTTENNTSNNYFTGYLSENNHLISLIDSTGFCKNDTTIFIKKYDPLIIQDSFYTCNNNIIMEVNSGGSNIGKWMINNFPISIDEVDSLNTTIQGDENLSFYLIYKDSFCNHQDSTKLIYASASPTLINSIDTICQLNQFKLIFVDSIHLSGVDWYSSGQFNSLYNKNISGGNHIIQFKNVYGCINDTLINVPTFPNPSINIPDKICGNRFDFTDNVGYEFGNWEVYSTDGYASFSNGNNLKTKGKITDYGNYSFVYTDERCLDRDTVNINFYPLPSGKITGPICEGINQKLIIIDSFPSYTSNYLWNDEVNSFEIYADEKGIYTCKIINECGEFEESIEINSNECSLIIPNVFSPNKDGKNDYFTIETTPPFDVFAFKIMNRWGEIVKTFDNSDFQWDGKDKNGNDLIEGVYYFIADIENKSVKKNYSGFIHLVR